MFLFIKKLTASHPLPVFLSGTYHRRGGWSCSGWRVGGGAVLVVVGGWVGASGQNKAEWGVIQGKE